ncbi:MAG: response regulator transcription factor, partial [Anaerolineales bacterium]
MTTILLADDHAVLRSGLKLLLESQPDLIVIGEASTGLETLDLAERLQPELILLDISMPGLNGLDALAALLKVAPQAKILILTMYDDPHYLRAALKQGASGYVLKKAADAELIS